MRRTAVVAGTTSPTVCACMICLPRAAAAVCGAAAARRLCGMCASWESRGGGGGPLGSQEVYIMSSVCL